MKRWAIFLWRLGALAGIGAAGILAGWISHTEWMNYRTDKAREILAGKRGCFRASLVAGENEKLKKLINLSGFGWKKDYYYCNLGKHKIYAPYNKERKSVSLSSKNGNLFIRMDGYSSTIFGKRKGDFGNIIIATVQDRNKDKLYDNISYETKIKDGDSLETVFDSNMDGSVDYFMKYYGKPGPGRMSYVECQGKEVPKDASHPEFLLRKTL